MAARAPLLQDRHLHPPVEGPALATVYGIVSQAGGHVEVLDAPAG